MRQKKKEIYIALNIIFDMFVLFTIFNFISTESLLFIGNSIENFFSFHTNWDVEKVRTFVTTITSGILGSTIVAMVFYFSEYKIIKEDSIIAVIRESNRLQDIYKDIPFMPCDGEYYELERAYYSEYKKNEWIREFNAELDKFEKRIPKADRRTMKKEIEPLRENLSHKYEEELTKLLTDNPILRKCRFSDDYIPVEQKLRDIITQYDVYIEKTFKSYSEIETHGLEELELLVRKYECRFNYSKKKRKRISEEFSASKVEGENIYTYDLTECVSSNDVCNRIYEVHCNLLDKYKSLMWDVEDIDKYNYRIKALNIFLILQREIYKIEKTKLIENVSEEYKDKNELNVVYSRILMNLANIQNILWGEISGEYKYIPFQKFIIRGKSVEYGQEVKSMTVSGDVLYGSIYRKKKETIY